VADDCEIYSWGRGDKGQLGNGHILRLHYPEYNQSFKELHGKNIRKLKAAYNGTVVLLEDGTLHGWGWNQLGQLGVRPQEFVRTDLKVYDALPVNMKYAAKDEKVVDFDLGMDTLCFLTDKNRVFYSGMDKCWVPYLLKDADPSDPVVKVSATQGAVAALTERGDMYVTNGYIEPFEQLNNKFLFHVPKEELFDGGRIIDFGGSYNVRYAIVQ
jgi:alpha-tubulin suppressor-like RCC1 family protein